MQWDLDAGPAAWIASIGFVGMAIGASLGGLLADRFGRRQVFAVTLLRLRPRDRRGRPGLVGRRAAGAALPGRPGARRRAAGRLDLVSEFAPARIRGRLVVMLEAFWAMGWTLAALIGYLVVPAVGRRLALGVRARRDPARYALVVRWGLPESVRFLERRGRDAEAEAVVRWFEASAGVDAAGRVAVDRAPRRGTPPPGPRGAVVGGHPAAHGVPVAGLVLRQLLVLRRLHLAPVDAGGAGLRPGALLRVHADHHAGAAARLRRRRVADRGVGAPADPVGVPGRLGGSRRRSSARPTATTDVLAAGMALSFFNLGAWGALYAVTPEMYPTSLRATGSGWAAGFGRIASIVAPLTVPLLLRGGGTALVFVVFAAFFAGSAARRVGAAGDCAAAALEEGRGAGHGQDNPAGCTVTGHERGPGRRPTLTTTRSSSRTSGWASCEYIDEPGDRTTPHAHPDSVMDTLSGFRRRLFSGERSGTSSSRQASAGGCRPRSTPVRTSARPRPEVIFVELKDGNAGPRSAGALGPQ